MAEEHPYRKVSSKKYIESLLEEDSDDALETALGHHTRADSIGSHKKKEGVSNSIKALQDKIKKGLDLNESSDPIRSPPMAMKNYRLNYERMKAPVPESEPIKPRNVSSEEKPIEKEVEVVKPEEIVTPKLDVLSPKIKAKPMIPQFKVVRRIQTPPVLPTSPVSCASLVVLNGLTSSQELKQLQIIDKEISKKIKKIKLEIKFIDSNLPPNACEHDFEGRKKMAAARALLEKNLEFWEKKKYENGINFSKLTRKVVYSGGEEVTTFFSGRIE